MLGTKINRFTFISVLLIISVMLSGCYTLVGYMPNAEEVSPQRDTTREYIHRDYDYYDNPYDWDYGDGYSTYYPYEWSPSYNLYHPWWYDDGYYRNDDSYYVPNKKPENKKREASEFRRSPQSDKGKIANEPKKSDEDQSNGKREEERRSPKKYRNED
jgi:hypothetical protein